MPCLWFTDGLFSAMWHAVARIHGFTLSELRVSLALAYFPDFGQLLYFRGTIQEFSTR
jgi:hypothetical protein